MLECVLGSSNLALRTSFHSLMISLMRLSRVGRSFWIFAAIGKCYIVLNIFHFLFTRLKRGMCFKNESTSFSFFFISFLFTCCFLI